MRGRIAIAASLALVASLFGPISASNAALVTKTFTVTKSDGTPYAGVLVGLFGLDRTENQTPIRTTPVLTNASGVAVIQVDENDRYWSYTLQPASGDYSHAPVSGSLVEGATESFRVQLKAANTKVIVQSADGSEAPNESRLYYPATGAIGGPDTEIQLLRAGGFGLDLSTSLSTSGKHFIQLYHDDSPGNFYREFGLTRSVSNGVSTFSLYPDLKYLQSSILSTTTIDGHDVYVLRFNAPNLFGSLRSNSGSTLAFGNPLSGYVAIYRSTADGSIDYSVEGYGAPIEADGSFRIRHDKFSAGRYLLQFRIAGSHNIPSFIGPWLYIDANGNYSLSENGPFVAPASFTYVANAPQTASALKLLTVNPTSGAAIDASIYLDENSNYGSIYYGPGRARNGQASFILRDGSYQLYISAVSDPLVPQNYTLTVDQGNFILKTGSGQTILPNAQGIFETPLVAPNLKLKIVNPNDPSITLSYNSVQVRKVINGQPEDESIYGSPINGLIPLNLDNGQYVVTAEVNQDVFAPRDYNLTISNGTITLTDTITGSTVTPSNGVYSLIPAPTNVTGRLVSPSGQALGQDTQGLSLQIQRKVGSSWRYFTWVGVKSDGTFNFRANTAGDYRVVVDSYNSAAYARSIFELTVNNPTQTLNIGDKALRASNFKVQLVASGSNEAIPYANFEIRPLSASVSESDFETWLSSGNSGVSGTELLATGTYTIKARRPWNYPSHLYSDKTYTLTVGGTPGNLTFSIPGITPVDGVFILSLGVPNVSGVVVSPTGQRLVLGNESWVDVGLQKQSGLDWDWINSISTSNSGEFGFNIQENGFYRLSVMPYGISDAGRVVTETFEITDLNRGTLAKSFSALALRAPTAKLGVVMPGSTTLVQSYIDIRKLDQNGETIGFDYLYSDSRKVFNYTADAAGTYEFTVNPDWNSRLESVSKTYRGTVTGTGPNTYSLSITGASVVDGVMQLPLGTPNLRGRVVSSNGEVLNLRNDSWIHASLQKYDLQEDAWWWAQNEINLDRDGRFVGFVSEAGTYRLKLNPYGIANQTMTYSSSFTVTQAGLATLNQNFGDIRLGSPNLVGEVLATTGTTKIAEAQVVAIDVITGREVWESTSQTNSEGKWFMNLPAGRYSLMAKAPWGSVTYGDSPLLENIVVANNGSVTIGGTPASSNIQIRLSAPTWSGTVVDPSTNEPIAQTSVCLWHYESDRNSNSCSFTDSQGRWALSKPAVFTGFNSNTTLSIHPRSPGALVEKRLQGSLLISQALGSYTPGNTYQNIVLSPAQPNVTITVKAGQAAAANVWVNISKPNVGWLAGGTTNNLGIVKVYIPNISGPLDIEAYTSGTMRESFATTKKSMTIADVSAAITGSNFATEVSLLAPNLRAIIYKPGATQSTPGDPVPGAYVSVFNETINEWVGSYFANSLGEVPASLPVPANGSHRFRLRVEPAGNNPDLLIQSEYFATVQANGNLTLTTAGNSAVTAVGGKFPLILTAPTITGTVSSSDGSIRIRDSRILPTDISTRFELWQYDAYSNRAGEFGMVLPNGSYFLVAYPSWGQQTEARSARCQVDIFNGALVSPASDCISNGKVNLKLRQPNLKFKLVHNGQPVKWAHVSLSVGNWYVDATSTSDGTVALFVDSDEIAAKNPGLTGVQDIRVNVHPNYDTAGIVRWSCNSGDSVPICSQLSDVTIGQSYSLANNGNLGEIAFMQPNTKLVVRAPGGGALKQNAWVTLYKQEQGWNRWLGSDNTDSNGLADFNLEASMVSDSTARYMVEIQAPWNERSSYARAQYRDLTYAQVNNQPFELRTPNLKLQIKQAFTGTESRWSYVEIQRQTDAQSDSWVWHDWASADETGTAAVLLDVVGKYRLRVYPGSGARGTQVTCDLEVTSNANVLTIAKVANFCDSGGTITNGSLDISLSPGNFRGTITADGAGIAGAIVFAQAVSDDQVPVPIAGKTAETVTNSDGTYGLQLSDQYRWQVRVFFVNPGGAAIRYGSILTPLTVEKAELTANKTWNAALPRQ